MTHGNTGQRSSADELYLSQKKPLRAAEALSLSSVPQVQVFGRRLSAQIAAIRDSIVIPEAMDQFEPGGLTERQMIQYRRLSHLILSSPFVIRKQPATAPEVLRSHH